MAEFISLDFENIKLFSLRTPLHALIIEDPKEILSLWVISLPFTTL